LGSYFGVFAPARTPPAIVAQLNAAFAKVIATPAGQDFLRAQTMDPVGAPAEAFADYVRRDQVRAAELFQFLGIQPTANPQ
jgi:tripartite-type tricarboxylate transporter receptor subunit TctC